MSISTQGRFYRRVLVLATFVLGFVALVVWQLVYLQLGQPSQALTNHDSGPKVVFPPKRGNIYDSHGYLLAAASTVYDIGAIPRKVKDAQVLADRLAPLLDIPRDELLALLQKDISYVLLKQRVSAEVKNRVLEIGSGALQADPFPGRVYPNGSLAGCVLGFVSGEGKGYYGIEGYYNELLTGEAGFRTAGYDALGSLFYRYRAPRDGADLFLTLDRNVQYIVEEVLAKTVVASDAKRGVAIVMEPATGAILAMAAYPSYDPNNFASTDQKLFINPAISDHYEPGSVFKIITIASALDAGVISPSSTYYDNGQIIVGGRVIKNADNAAHGETSIADLLAHSLNVGAAHVSTSLGAFKFYEYLHRFGFGRLTGVDLAYEVPGKLRVPGDRDWHESDLGTNSFGQGLAVTPLQMLRAVSAVANRGRLMRPHVVARIVEKDKITDLTPQVEAQVISPEVAAQVTDMLVYAVDTVLTEAKIPDYQVAGKSGTSQVPVLGGYDPNDTIASFAGYAPASDPQFSMLVVIDRPQKGSWGLTVAAPAFREIVQQLFTLLAVPPSSVHASM